MEMASKKMTSSVYENVDQALVYECHKDDSQLQNQKTFDDLRFEESFDIGFFDVHEFRSGGETFKKIQNFCFVTRKQCFVFFVANDEATNSEVSIIEWNENEHSIDGQISDQEMLNELDTEDSVDISLVASCKFNREVSAVKMKSPTSKSRHYSG